MLAVRLLPALCGLSFLGFFPLQAEDWPDQVFEATNLEAVFLTNDFDDPLEGFDTSRYIPCLRTDDLVLNLGDTGIRDRLAKSTGTTVTSISSDRLEVPFAAVCSSSIVVVTPSASKLPRPGRR